MKSSKTWVRRLMPRGWWAAVVLLCVPGAIISGCGGGGGGLSPSATPTAGPAFSGTLRLSARQSATLSLSTQGRAAQGTLVVGAPTAGLAQAANIQEAQVLAPMQNNWALGRKKSKVAPGEQSLSAQAISVSLPAGTYRVSGSFTAPRGFSVTGEFPAPIGPFSLSGQLPLPPADAGSFTLLANGQSTSGTFVLPAVTSTPSTTATPSGTGTLGANATATTATTPAATAASAATTTAT